VPRVLIVVFLALLMFDVSGLAALCGDPACDEDCPADASAGECAPNCHACSCCSLPKVLETAAVTFVVPPAEATSWIRSSERLPTPEPADILHVPKPLLA
jgi:hypothetical protein